MGDNLYSPSTYDTVTKPKIDAGTNFAHSKTTANQPPQDRKAHPILDPKGVAGPTSPVAGRNIRESRDSDTHPVTTPVAVGFDVTASMGTNPVVLQAELPQLLGLLLRKGYVQGPQVLIGAYGDTRCDYVPLQIGQFEAGNEIDTALDSLYLELGGGGNNGETSTLFAEFLAHHTATDAWDKRAKRGYAFIIGDERAREVTREQLNQFLRLDNDPAEAGLDVEETFKAALERWELFVLVINNYTAQSQDSVRRYKELVGGDHVVTLELSDGDVVGIAETIAGIIGVHEGSVDVDQALNDMGDVGSSADAQKAAGQALQPYRGRSVAARGEAPSDLVTAGSEPTQRL